MGGMAPPAPPGPFRGEPFRGDPFRGEAPPYGHGQSPHAASTPPPHYGQPPPYPNMPEMHVRKSPLPPQPAFFAPSPPTSMLPATGLPCSLHAHGIRHRRS